MGADQARVAAEKWRKVAASGLDPIVERERQHKQAAAKRPTLAAVA